MERIEARPENLPPLSLTKLRELDVVEPEASGRPAHLAEASGLSKRGDWVYVVGDENLNLGVFRLSSEAPGELRSALAGTLPTDPDQRKSAKPDLEALATLSPFPGHPHGLLMGVGSGSGPDRDRGFMWSLAADGSLSGEATEIDLGPVYGMLGEEMGGLNIEGAVVLGDGLWLLNRGNRGGPNALIKLWLSEVQASMHTDLDIDPSELAEVRAYDLGELNGVPLNFSDGDALPDGTLVFTASAENDDPGPSDAEIEGSVVGTITEDGAVRRLCTIDRRWKVEGVFAVLDTGVIDLLFCCDQDDPDHGSPLLSATLPYDP